MSGSHSADSRMKALDALASMTVVELSTSSRAAKTGAIRLTPGGSGHGREIVTRIASRGATVYGPREIDPKQPIRLVFGPKGGTMESAALRQKGWCRLIGPESVESEGA